MNLSSLRNTNSLVEGSFCQPGIPIRDDDSRASSQSSQNGDVDKLIAKQLNSMSLEEREFLYEEIHGVENEVDETEDFVSNQLALLEIEINFLVKTRRGDIYEQAIRENPSYVCDREFRLMFLRADYFDPKKAARRIMRFLERKVKFFGLSSLTRTITLDDFSSDDMAYMKAGRMQLLSSRDHKGRAVLADLHMDDKTKYVNIDNVIKSFLYLVYAAAEDEETQRRGLVLLYYFSANFGMAADWQKRDRSLLECIPIKVTGFHFCANNAIIKAMKMIMPLLYRRTDLVKFRFHVGSLQEAHYSLMSYGTPVNTLPVSYTGDLKTGNHHKWLGRRSAKEAEIKALGEGSFTGVDLPGTRDILLGSGKTVQDHVGNLFLRTHVLERLDEYQRTAKLEKNNVAMEIVVQIKRAGGRFLKRTNEKGWWMEVNNEVAREKVSSTFRTIITTQQRLFVNHDNRKRSRLSAISTATQELL